MIRRVILINKLTLERSANLVLSFFRPPATPQFALAPCCAPAPSTVTVTSSQTSNPSLADCLWLAVPKRKVTPGKKRMKTTNQNRIKKKAHIIVDGRTGETTLRHRLPFNWKDYLPGN